MCGANGDLPRECGYGVNVLLTRLTLTALVKIYEGPKSTINHSSVTFIYYKQLGDGYITDWLM